MKVTSSVPHVAVVHSKLFATPQVIVAGAPASVMVVDLDAIMALKTGEATAEGLNAVLTWLLTPPDEKAMDVLFDEVTAEFKKAGLDI